MSEITKTGVTTTKTFYRKKAYYIKENGLPDGEGMYWLKGSRKYIYAKIGGKPISCNTADWKEAIDFIETKKLERAKRETELVTGDVVVNNLLDDLLVYLTDLGAKRGDYRPATAYITGTQINMKDGIRDTFGDLKVSKIRPPMYGDYRRKWELIYQNKGKKTDQVQNTIDHHLGYLKRAITLGQQNYKVSKDIPLPKLDKRNTRTGARKGFITLQQSDILLAKLPDWCAAVFAACYATGTRKKESTFIRRKEVHFDERIIGLKPTETKAFKGRNAPIGMKYWSVIMDWEMRTRKDHPDCTWLFHREGEQLTAGEIYRTFNTVCEAEGWHIKLPGRKYDRSAVRWHDARRSATTNFSNLETITGNDVQTVAGLTEQTHILYDRTNAVMKIRDAIDKKDAAIPSVVVSVPVMDWKAELKELKQMMEDGILTQLQFESERDRVMLSRVTA